MRYDIDGLLRDIEDGNTKTEAFAESLSYFSLKPKEFRRGFMYYDNNDKRWDIYNKLFYFLPITKELIGSIASEDFSDEEDLIGEGEGVILEGYFTFIREYRNYLEENSVNLEKLRSHFDSVEILYKDRKNRNTRLKRNKNTKNKVVKERDDLLKELGIEKVEKIRKAEERASRYNEKLKELLDGGKDE